MGSVGSAGLVGSVGSGSSLGVGSGVVREVMVWVPAIHWLLSRFSYHLCYWGCHLGLFPSPLTFTTCISCVCVDTHRVNILETRQHLRAHPLQPEYGANFCL